LKTGRIIPEEREEGIAVQGLIVDDLRSFSAVEERRLRIMAVTLTTELNSARYSQLSAQLTPTTVVKRRIAVRCESSSIVVMDYSKLNHRIFMTSNNVYDVNQTAAIRKDHMLRATRDSGNS
jgi:hypothetical protein